MMPSTRQSLLVSLLVLVVSVHAFGPQARFGVKTRRTTTSALHMTAAPPAPTLNGKMVLPLAVIAPGLQDHKVAAVYAVLNSQYKRGAGDGWEYCEHVGMCQDLGNTLKNHLKEYGKDKVAHVRALSFAYPAGMKDAQQEWRQLVQEAGGTLNDWKDDSLYQMEEDAILQAIEDTTDDDEDDDEDRIVSPFESAPTSLETHDDATTMPFTRDNVDKVLEEVRPYLISDGGNVAVDRVDEETKNVYLVLQGACGSCASSTVTMQMGIERVLKENFPDLGEVIQVDDPANAPPTELTWEVVEQEVKRIQPAITAMGGVMKLKRVDPIGEVEIEFRGPNKVQKGVEMAIQDVPLVKHVKFVMN